MFKLCIVWNCHKGDMAQLLHAKKTPQWRLKVVVGDTLWAVTKEKNKVQVWADTVPTTSPLFFFCFTFRCSCLWLCIRKYITALENPAAGEKRNILHVFLWDWAVKHYSFITTKTIMHHCCCSVPSMYWHKHKLKASCVQKKTKNCSVKIIKPYSY